MVSERLEPYQLHFHGARALYAREVVYPRGLAMGNHHHERAHLVFVVHGCVRSAWRKEEVENDPGTFFYLPAGEPHSNEFGNRFQSLDVWFEPRWIPELIERSGSLAHPSHHLGGAGVSALRRLHREFRHADDLTPLVMEALVVEALAEIARAASQIGKHRPPRWLTQARELLHGRFRESVGLREIAAAVDVHPGHLARTFRAHYGCTPGEYVRRLRIERAQRLLASTELPVGTIAAELGFADHSHFGRTFKQTTGVTPAQYRRGS